ncbi:hypothetical protein Esti_006657 [Eimeria stiedai]
MKPLRTPDLQRRRQQQQQQQQHGRPFNLKQQIEQQHQQQLMPWNGSQPAVGSRYSPLSQGSNKSSSSSSSRQLFAAAPSSMSPSSDGGSSVDVVPFEEMAQRMLQGGGPVRRLRFSASRHSKSLVVARLPDRLRTLKQPIAITRDVPLLPPGTEPHVLAAAAAAAPWRLQIPPRRPQQKTFVTRKNEVDASCFFILVEGQGVLDVLPVAEFLTFERTLGTQQPPPEELEQRSKAQASLDAALTQRAAGEETERETDEPAEGDRRARPERGAGSLAAIESEGERDREREDKERERRRGREREASGARSHGAVKRETLTLPLLVGFCLSLSHGDGRCRQKKKRLKGFRKRDKDKNDANEYINSALSIGNLRQEAVTWDFEEGERSDDEGGEAPQDAKEQQEETLEAEPVETESEEDAADPLTSFGQKMKSLLDKAREDEADAELHQYESDDEEDETAEEKGQEATPAASSSAAGGPPSDLGQRTVSSTSSRGPQGPPSSQQAAQSGPPQPAAGGPRETLEARVVRVMQQHMGRMSVKDFMNAFKVKQKNEEFKRIQAVVHKVCKMEASEDKQKFIVLKPEFRL